MIVFKKYYRCIGMIILFDKQLKFQFLQKNITQFSLNICDIIIFIPICIDILKLNVSGK